jgi:lysyl-tRNA synthetase class 1
LQAQTRVDLREGGDVKLPWRMDWPMRWAFEGVCFEPGGKDHSTAGGSFDTAKQIVGPVFGWVAPEYVAYDFVRIKGGGGKISSSAGGATTVADCLEVYEPEMLRWIFASQRPNSEFQISFDADVIKLYEDYDRAVATAHAPDSDDPGGKSDKKRQIVRRTLELSRLVPGRIEPGTTPVRVPRCGLSITLQIYDGDSSARSHHARRAGGTGEAGRSARAARRLDRDRTGGFRYRIRDAGEEPPLDEPREILARLVRVSNDAGAAKDLVPHLNDVRGVAHGAGSIPSHELLIAAEGPG